MLIYIRNRILFYIMLINIYRILSIVFKVFIFVKIIVVWEKVILELEEEKFGKEHTE